MDEDDDPASGFLLDGPGLAEMQEVLGPRSQERDCVLFVRAWAEAVLRQLERVRAMRTQDAADSRNYERNEEWSPTEDHLERNFRSLWTEEHMLVWAARQLEQWSQRLAQERGEQVPQTDKTLLHLRDALEHLDDAKFSRGHAVPGAIAKANRGLRSLPESKLGLVVGGGLSFGLIDPDEMESRALAIVRAIEDELDQDAADQYFDMLEE